MTGPVRQINRVAALDVLRGFGLLGILPMTIVGFGLCYEANSDPTAAGGATVADLAAWAFFHVTAAGSMRALFSLIFGASMTLMASRLEGRPDAADIYCRRLLWLMLMGIAHLFLLWQNDVLYLYAVCALVLYPFRNLRARNLLTLGAVGLLLLSAYTAVTGFNRRNMIRLGREAAEKAVRQEMLSERETDARREWDDFVKRRHPSPERLRRDAEEWQGGYVSVIKARAHQVLKHYSVPLFHPSMLNVWGMMFVGMGLMRSGVLTGRHPMRVYQVLLGAGYGIGIPLNGYAAWLLLDSSFDPVVERFATCLYPLARLSVAVGHIALILILLQKGRLRWLTDRLAAVGQMSLTNYIMNSFVCALIFTGYGFGLYGRLERIELYALIFPLWTAQLILSPIWVRNFRHGPAEWILRSLTYWRWLPFRRGGPLVSAL